MKKRSRIYEEKRKEKRFYGMINVLKQANEKTKQYLQSAQNLDPSERSIIEEEIEKNDTRISNLIEKRRGTRIMQIIIDPAPPSQ